MDETVPIQVNEELEVEIVVHYRAQTQHAIINIKPLTMRHRLHTMSMMQLLGWSFKTETGGELAPHWIFHK